MLIDQIKTAQLQARKNRDSVRALALTTLIGEAEAVGKNNGNRAPTDVEVVAVIKKFIKNIDEVLKVANPETDGYKDAVTEKALLGGFLPKQLSVEELQDLVRFIVAGLPKPTVGEVMKALKAGYDGQYDGAMASKIIKDMLNK